MPTLDQIRRAPERELRDALRQLDSDHRQLILEALDEYGHPRDIPEAIWERIRTEQEERLAAILLLLMVSGDDWTAQQLESQGVGIRSARPDATYALQAARQAQIAAAQATDTLRNRIHRSVTDALASPRGGVGEISKTATRQAVNDVFTAARREQIEVTQSTRAVTTGQRGAEARLGGDGAALDTGQAVEIEMRWRTRPYLAKSGRSCEQCAALEGATEDVWGLVYPDGPGDEAHPHCNCYLEPVVVVQTSAV